MGNSMRGNGCYISFSGDLLLFVVPLRGNFITVTDMVCNVYTYILLLHGDL